MDKEKLRQANKLEEDIRNLESDLFAWKHSVGIWQSLTLSCEQSDANRQHVDATVKYRRDGNLHCVDFSIIKALAISKIEERLSQLKKQFAEM